MEKQLVLKNKISEVTLLAEFVETIGKELSLSTNQVLNLNLALEEAVSNVILYAFPRDEAHEFVLHAKYDKEAVAFQLVDSGVPFDPTQVSEPDTAASAAEREIGGLGIFLIRQLMDEVHYRYHNGMNTLTLIKRLSESITE